MPEAADRTPTTKKATTKRTTTKKKTAARKRTKRTKQAAAGQAMLRVKQVRSGIGHAATYRRTLQALGIRHHQQVVTLADTPSTRGALHKVRHLVEVSPASGENQ